MNRPLVALASAIALAAGCASPTRDRNGWAYIGADNTLRNPPFSRDRTAPSDVRQDLAAWQARRSEAADADRRACAQETGEPALPNRWTGYGNAFMACMTARGWILAGDPL